MTQRLDKISQSLRTHRTNIRTIFNDQDHFQQFKAKLVIGLPFWVAALLTAIMAALFSKVFSFTEKTATWLSAQTGYWGLLYVPILFFLSWWIVDRFAPFANGSGIPQLMAAVELSAHDNLEKSKMRFIDRLLSFRIIIVKVLSSLIAVLGGAAIGREGPTLQISGSIFHLTGKIFFKKAGFARDHHSLILAGGAAGLAAAFNTPLGGIAYVVEELSKSHLSSFRTGILQAVIVSGIFAQLILGPYLYLGYPKADPFELINLGRAMVLSIFAATIATLFGQALKLVVLYRAQIVSQWHKAVTALLCGLAFAAMSIFLSKTANGSGKELLTQFLFEGRKAEGLDVVARFFGTSITYAVGGAGGIFAPVLSIGGACTSYLAELLGYHIGPVTVLIGMTAALAALTQSPFTSFVLVLEMTDRHSAIFPLMIAALLGQGISKFATSNSFYDYVCHRILTNENQGDSPRS